MTAFQLFEDEPPFAGLNPVEAARQAALHENRPELGKLSGKQPFPFNVRL